ncbi:MAG: flagellin [Firmicutes bacterium]|nr:flagellin [Bacillota bacterium]
MIINNNIPALNTYRQLTTNNLNTNASMEKLSSGLRINRAGDDAAGLAISEKMRGQIRGLDQATRNAQDSISLIQTAEGALNETHAILQRMRELTVQSANDTNTAIDRKELQKEIDQLSEEITRIGNTTEFNTQKLLTGKFEGTFHIGANEQQNLQLNISDMRGFTLGMAGTVQKSESVTITAGVGGTVDFADGTYTVKDEGGGDYSLIDIEGNVAATSNDRLNFLATGGDGDDIITFVETAVVGSQVVVSGTGTNAAGTTEVTNNGLEAGQYRLNFTAGASTITDANGKVVAFGDAAGTPDRTFIDVDGNTVLELSADATDHMDLTVGGIDISSQTAANVAITGVNDAIETVSAERSKLGAYQNRLEHTINNLSTSSENLTASESRIRDVDMAKEIMAFTKNNILAQASQAMLAQANQQPQAVLQLLR